MKYKENLTQEWRAALLSDTEIGLYHLLLVIAERYIQKPPRSCLDSTPKSGQGNKRPVVE